MITEADLKRFDKVVESDLCVPMKTGAGWRVTFSFRGEPAQRIDLPGRTAQLCTDIEVTFQRQVSTYAQRGWIGGFVRCDCVFVDGSSLAGLTHTHTNIDILCGLHPGVFGGSGDVSRSA